MDRASIPIPTDFAPKIAFLVRRYFGSSSYNVADLERDIDALASKYSTSGGNASHVYSLASRLISLISAEKHRQLLDLTDQIGIFTGGDVRRAGNLHDDPISDSNGVRRSEDSAGLDPDDERYVSNYSVSRDLDSADCSADSLRFAIEIIGSSDTNTTWKGYCNRVHDCAFLNTDSSYAPFLYCKSLLQRMANLPSVGSVDALKNMVCDDYVNFVNSIGECFGIGDLFLDGDGSNISNLNDLLLHLFNAIEHLHGSNDDLSRILLDLHANLSNINNIKNNLPTVDLERCYRAFNFKMLGCARDMMCYNRSAVAGNLHRIGIEDSEFDRLFVGFTTELAELYPKVATCDLVFLAKDIIRGVSASGAEVDSVDEYGAKSLGIINEAFISLAFDGNNGFRFSRVLENEYFGPSCFCLRTTRDAVRNRVDDWNVLCSDLSKLNESLSVAAQRDSSIFTLPSIPVPPGVAIANDVLYARKRIELFNIIKDIDSGSTGNMSDYLVLKRAEELLLDLLEDGPIEGDIGDIDDATEEYVLKNGCTDDISALLMIRKIADPAADIERDSKINRKIESVLSRVRSMLTVQPPLMSVNVDTVCFNYNWGHWLSDRFSFVDVASVLDREMLRCYDEDDLFDFRSVSDALFDIDSTINSMHTHNEAFQVAELMGDCNVLAKQIASYERLMTRLLNRDAHLLVEDLYANVKDLDSKLSDCRSLYNRFYGRTDDVSVPQKELLVSAVDCAAASSSEFQDGAMCRDFVDNHLTVILKDYSITADGLIDLMNDAQKGRCSDVDLEILSTILNRMSLTPSYRKAVNEADQVYGILPSMFGAGVRFGKQVLRLDVAISALRMARILVIGTAGAVNGVNLSNIAVNAIRDIKALTSLFNVVNGVINSGPSPSVPDGSDKAIIQPNGTIVKGGVELRPDGGIVRPDGVELRPDGTVIKPDGTTVKPDGTVIEPKEPEVKPDGTVIKPDGTTVKPDGTVTRPDGTVTRPDGTIVKPDGTVIEPKEPEVKPDGTIVRPDGVELRPDGTVIDADGNEIDLASVDFPEIPVPDFSTLTWDEILDYFADYVGVAVAALSDANTEEAQLVIDNMREELIPSLKTLETAFADLGADVGYMALSFVAKNILSMIGSGVFDLIASKLRYGASVRHYELLGHIQHNITYLSDSHRELVAKIEANVDELSHLHQSSINQYTSHLDIPAMRFRMGYDASRENLDTKLAFDYLQSECARIVPSKDAAKNSLISNSTSPSTEVRFDGVDDLVLVVLDDMVRDVDSVYQKGYSIDCIGSASPIDVLQHFLGVNVANQYDMNNGHLSNIDVQYLDDNELTVADSNSVEYRRSKWDAFKSLFRLSRQGNVSDASIPRNVSTESHRLGEVLTELYSDVREVLRLKNLLKKVMSCIMRRQEYLRQLNLIRVSSDVMQLQNKYDFGSAESRGLVSCVEGVTEKRLLTEISVLDSMLVDAVKDMQVSAGIEVRDSRDIVITASVIDGLRDHIVELSQSIADRSKEFGEKLQVMARLGFSVSAKAVDKNKGDGFSKPRVQISIGSDGKKRFQAALLPVKTDDKYSKPFALKIKRRSGYRDASEKTLLEYSQTKRDIGIH